jgi:site-specific recombinase XerD
MLPEIEGFQKWLRRRSPDTSTHVHYTSDVKLFFAGTDKSLAEITVHDVDAYIDRSQENGHATATVNRRLAALRTFYHFLEIELEDPPPNPVLPKYHYIRVGQRLPRDVQDREIEQLFEVIRSPRDRAMFLLMVRCGLRVGEVRRLSMDDLYLDPAMGSLPRLWLCGKGGKERVVYLSEHPLSGLRNWLALRPKVMAQAVFLNRFGRRLTVTGIQDRLASYCHKAGIWITCHQLRHTFGRHLTEARVPVTSIQRLLGHARLRTTEVYLHVADSQVQADYETAMQEVIRRLPLEGGTS